MVLYETVKRYTLRMFGRGGAVFGTPPAIGEGEFLIQSGRTQVISNAGGDGILTFPVAFPTGHLMTIIQPANYSSNGGIIININTATTSKSVCNFNVRTADNVNWNATFLVTWIAIGW